MKTLTEIKKETDNIFNQELQIPKPNIHLQRKFDALREFGLKSHYKKCSFDIRCQQASDIGLQKITLDDMFELMTGEKSDGSNEIYCQNGYINGEKYPPINSYQWLAYYFDYEDNKERYYNIAHEIEFRYKLNNEQPFFRFFGTNFKYVYLYGCIDLLKQEIPYGILLRINELKKLKIFTTFKAMAPINAWNCEKPIDPIITAEIYDEKRREIYFIAQW